MVHPIIDQYYSHNPYHHRSSQYVVDKGLVTNEKSAATTKAVNSPRGTSPAPLSQSSLLQEEVKRAIPQSRLSEIIRSRSPAESLPSYSQHLQAENLAAMAGPSDERHTSPQLGALTARDVTKPQEQTNTKKKRISRAEVDGTAEEQQNVANEERQNSYGDPAKIAQYFPELRLS